MNLLGPLGSSSYKGMCIQDNAAEFAGTTDSTAAAAAEWQQSQSLLAETDQPEMRTMHKQSRYFYPEQRGNHLARTEMTTTRRYRNKYL